jgi:type I restriction enzyme S subunit
MKSEWQTSTLGDVLAVIRNGVNCKQDKSGNGDRISRIESISHATFDLDKVGYAELSERDKEKNRLLPGDVLFSHINSAVHVGKTAVFDSDEPVYHGVNLLLMRPKEVVTSAYLDHALKYLFQSGYWRGVCKQSVNQASVNQQDISRVEIRYPKSLPEQQRIVGILDEAFEGIARAKANAEKNLQNARALFESHLQSVFTHRGDGWVDTKLDDVTDLITCGVAKRPDYVSEGIPFLSAKNVKSGKVIWSGHQYVSEESHLALTKHNKPKIGDILYTRVGSYGEAAIIDRDVEFSIFVSLTLIKPKSVVLNSFLKHYLNSSTVKALAAASITGSGVGNLNVGTVREFPIHLPPLSEQQSIVFQLDALREETQRLASLYTRKLAALEGLKKSLLHQAFSGEL